MRGIRLLLLPAILVVWTELCSAGLTQRTPPTITNNNIPIIPTTHAESKNPNAPEHSDVAIQRSDLIAEDYMEMETDPEVPHFSCTVGTFCVVDLMTLLDLDEHSAIVVVQLLPKDNDLLILEYKKPTKSLIGIPTGDGQIDYQLQFIDNNGEMEETSFQIQIHHGPVSNHRIDLLLVNTPRVNCHMVPHECVVLLEDIAESMDGAPTSLTIEHIRHGRYNSTLVVFHNNTLASGECNMDDLNAMKSKLIGDQDVVSKEFVKKMAQHGRSVGNMMMEMPAVCQGTVETITTATTPSHSTIASTTMIVSTTTASTTMTSSTISPTIPIPTEEPISRIRVTIVVVLCFILVGLLVHTIKEFKEEVEAKKQAEQTMPPIRMSELQHLEAAEEDTSSTTTGSSEEL